MPLIRSFRGWDPHPLRMIPAPAESARLSLQETPCQHAVNGYHVLPLSWFAGECRWHWHSSKPGAGPRNALDHQGNPTAEESGNHQVPETVNRPDLPPQSRSGVGFGEGKRSQLNRSSTACASTPRAAIVYPNPRRCTRWGRPVEPHGGKPGEEQPAKGMEVTNLRHPPLMCRRTNGSQNHRLGEST